MAKTLTEIRSYARKHSPMAMRVLVEIARCETAKDAARVKAATTIIEFGYGKAVQPLVGGEDGSNEIRITVRKIIDASYDEGPTEGS